MALVLGRRGDGQAHEHGCKRDTHGERGKRRINAKENIGQYTARRPVFCVRFPDNAQKIAGKPWQRVLL